MTDFIGDNDSIFLPESYNFFKIEYKRKTIESQE